MGDGAVVALEIVLDAHLPVGVVLRIGPLMKLERADVDAALLDQAWEVAEVLGERRGLEVGVDEHERAPGIDLHRPQAVGVAVEARLGLGSSEPCATSRRGRTSTRDTGTATSRAVLLPRTAGSRGGGRR